jgi:hypothetical protein
MQSVCGDMQPCSDKQAKASRTPLTSLRLGAS